MTLQTKQSKQRKQSFIQGALILSVGTILVKIIGAIFKIPLTNLIDAQGFGYFNTAYNLYMPIYTIATAGFPIAIARMVAEKVALKQYNDVKQIYRVAVPLFTGTGIAGFLLMFGGAAPYANYINNSGAFYSILVLAPTLLFSCMMSVQRGYYEGLRNMYPTAVSQVIEALCKLLLGLLVASLVLSTGVANGLTEYRDKGTVYGQVVEFTAEDQREIDLTIEAELEQGVLAESARAARAEGLKAEKIEKKPEVMARDKTLPFAAAGAILGVTVGSVMAYLYLLIRHRRKGDGISKEELLAAPPAMGRKEIFRALLAIAIPIALGALVTNIANVIDVTLIQNRLGAIQKAHPGYLKELYGLLLSGVSEGEIVTTLYGCYGMAQTLYTLVPTLTQAFGISALPNVTTAWVSGDRNDLKKNIESVIRITALVSIPAGLGLSVMAGPIMRLIYSSPSAVQIATPVLTVLGITVVFVAISIPLSSMIQAVGRVDLPVKFMAVGAAVKLVTTYVLVGIPSVNLNGGPVGHLLCYIIILLLDIIALCRITKIVPNFNSVFIKPLISAVICCGAAWGAQGLCALLLPDKLATVIGLGIAVIVYVVSLLVLKAVSKDDVLMLPKGQKIAKILEKYNWIG